MSRHTVTPAWQTKKEPCQARLASNCATSGPVAGTVDRLPACGPCINHARTSNAAADRRRG